MLYSYVSSWFILYINSLLFGYLAITWVLDTYFSSRNRFEAFVGALYWSIRTFDWYCKHSYVFIRGLGSS